ncbi:unnamed protein product [Musa banksii]
MSSLVNMASHPSFLTSSTAIAVFPRPRRLLRECTDKMWCRFGLLFGTETPTMRRSNRRSQKLDLKLNLSLLPTMVVTPRGRLVEDEASPHGCKSPPSSCLGLGPRPAPRRRRPWCSLATHGASCTSCSPRMISSVPSAIKPSSTSSMVPPSPPPPPPKTTSTATRKRG